ncbi:efflux RND transporter permease subunit, partial [Klebsiella pneumoniae]|nr:efflux RND transporter permease subunit [Klebsiella pneumoniae]
LLVPLFGHYLLRNAKTDEDPDAAYDGPWYNRYRRLAGGVLHRPCLTVGVLVVLTVVSMVLFTRLPQSFFPPSSTPLFYVNLFLPQGTH